MDNKINSLEYLGDVLGCIDPPARGGYLAFLINNLPDSIMAIDENCIVISFNRSAEIMFGYSAEEAIGQNLKIFMTSPDREKHDGYIADFLQSAGHRLIRCGQMVLARHKSGRLFPIDILVRKAKIGEKYLFVAFIHNATNREELRKRFVELSRALARADRISSMGLLAGAIAHDINQPLAAVRNYVEAVSAMAARGGELDGAAVSEAMDACAHEVERAGEIIRRLRQYVSQGDTEAKEESLTALIETALSLALADGEGSGVDVQVIPNSVVDDVLVDGIEIQQVIVNLVRNALQAMGGKGLRVLRISMSSCEVMAQVTIEDSGDGISTDHDCQMFLPFATGKADGLGLGLSICRMIVEAHNGKIWFGSSDLGGAAVHFTVPLMRPAGET